MDPETIALFASPWGALIIFSLRIVDVSCDTMRVIFAIRGRRVIAGVLGFTQAFIWIFAVGTAIQFLDSWLHIFGYAGGFAVGTMVGVTIEGAVAYGLATVRIVSRHGGVEIAEALRERGFGVTEFAAQGRDGRMEVLYAVLRRRDLPLAFEQVSRWDPQAFVTVEEPRAIHRGWMTEIRRK